MLIRAPLALSKEGQGYAFGVVSALIWGGFLVVTRQGVNAGLDAADLAFLRYETAGLLLLPWFARNARATLAKVGWGKGILLTLLVGPLFVLVGASGFQFAPLAHSAVLQLGTVTLIGIVLSALIAGERLSGQRFVGLAIIIAGLAIAAGPSLMTGGPQAWKGDLLFVIAGLMWGVYTVLQRRWQVEPLTATAIVSVLSALVYGPAYLAIRGVAPLLAADPAMLAQQALFLGVFAGIVALFAFGRTVEYLGGSRASLFPALAPSAAILLGIPLAGEVPSIEQIAGMIVLTTGLVVAIRSGGAPSDSGRGAETAHSPRQ